MYTAPKSFLNRLHSTDKRLGCRYEQDLERFLITYQRPFGDPIPLLIVETEEKHFRFPAECDIEVLNQWDMENMRLKDRLAMVTSYMEKYREKQRQRCKDDIRHMTRDSKIQLTNAFGKLVSGKNNSAFRRVSPQRRLPDSASYRVIDNRVVQSAAA